MEDISKKTISIFGSTGSIGRSSISFIKDNPLHFKVFALAAKSNFNLLAKQARELRPEYIIIVDEDKYSKLKELLVDLKDIKILSGFESLLEISRIKCDLVISAIVGAIGIKPTLESIKAGSNIALANKESLICGGRFLKDIAQENNVKIIPIDSEHNAILQIFERNNLFNIADITLTASGGPFFFSDYDLNKVTIDQAIKHPNWSMGAKISVDSATMMNKGLELIEAYYLFPVKIEQLNAIIHPQSIIHGMVNYNDGSTLSVMSLPDMRIPISYALSYPKRMSVNIDKIDLSKIQKLEFFALDNKRFPAINLCLNALKLGGNMIISLNAANEIAVQNFLNKNLSFARITDFVNDFLEKIEFKEINSIDEVIEYDIWARNFAKSLLKKYNDNALYTT